MATHSIRQFPLHFPSRVSPCAITFQLESTNNGSYLLLMTVCLPVDVLFYKRPLPVIEIGSCSVTVIGPISSVSIATRYGLDNPGIESRWEARFSAPVQTGPGAHPASYTMGTGSLPGVERPGVSLTTHPI